MTDKNKLIRIENNSDCGCKETISGTAIAFPVQAYRELFPHGLEGERIGNDATNPIQCRPTIETVGKGTPFTYVPSQSAEMDCPEPTAEHRAKADALAAIDLQDYAKVYCEKNQVSCLGKEGNCNPLGPLKLKVTSRDQSSKPQKDKTKKSCALTTNYSATVTCACI